MQEMHDDPTFLSDRICIHLRYERWTSACHGISPEIPGTNRARMRTIPCLIFFCAVPGNPATDPVPGIRLGDMSPDSTAFVLDCLFFSKTVLHF